MKKIFGKIYITLCFSLFLLFLFQLFDIYFLILQIILLYSSVICFFVLFPSIVLLYFWFDASVYFDSIYNAVRSSTLFSSYRTHSQKKKILTNF